MEIKKSTGPRLISGVIVLTVSNLVVKLLGLFCKIPLHGILQDQGMGYFNIAYNIFTTLYLIFHGLQDICCEIPHFSSIFVI